MSLNGQTGSLELSDILSLYISEKHNGTLVIKAPSNTFHLVCASKQLIGIHADKIKISMEDALVNLNMVKKDQIAEISNLAQTEQKPFTEILLRSHGLMEEELQQVRYYQAEQTFLDLLDVDTGEFEFLSTTPKDYLKFDIAFREWIFEIWPDIRKIKELCSVFPSFDDRIFWTSPKNFKGIPQQLSLLQLKVIAKYRPKITPRQYWYTLSEPRNDIIEALSNLIRLDILTTQFPASQTLPDSRPFLRAILVVAIDKIENVTTLIGENGEITEILKTIKDQLVTISSGTSPSIKGQDALNDLSNITSSMEDLLKMDNLDELEIDESHGSPGKQKSPPKTTKTEKAKPKESESLKNGKSQKAKITIDDAASYEDGLTVEDRVATKIKYRQFVSNVTMAHNRLNLQSQTYFDMLEVTPNADRRKIHKNFMNKIKKINPKGIRLEKRDEEYLEKAISVRDQLKKAYKTLMDQKLRREYIHSLKSERESEEKKKSEALRLFNKGMVVLKDGDFDKARDLFKQAIKWDPTNAVYYDMLESIEKEERTTNATKFFQAGILAYSQKNDAERAVKLIKQAIKLISNQPTFYIKLAEIQASRPETREDAIHSYELAIDMDPGNIELRHVLAGYLKKIGKKQQAANTYQEILKWSPDNLAAKKELITLKKDGVKPSRTAKIDRKKRAIEMDEDVEF